MISQLHILDLHLTHFQPADHLDYFRLSQWERFYLSRFDFERMWVQVGKLEYLRVEYFLQLSHGICEHFLQLVVFHQFDFELQFWQKLDQNLDHHFIRRVIVSNNILKLSSISVVLYQVFDESFDIFGLNTNDFYLRVWEIEGKFVSGRFRLYILELCNQF